jgi:hypothetical protein
MSAALLYTLHVPCHIEERILGASRFSSMQVSFEKEIAGLQSLDYGSTSLSGAWPSILRNPTNPTNQSPAACKR